MSPSIAFCHHKCLFCWRDVSITSTTWEEEFDEPGEIIDDCIKAQRKLLVGYFGNPNANSQKIKEAQNPTNPAIGDLLEEYKKRNFTTFLVSNGLSPEKLENIKIEPTQLYLSLDAPNAKIYRDICDPQVKNGWNALNKSLELLSSFKCRTVIRMTCVSGYNMTNPEEYARIIRESNPDFVEIKAYMFVGSSRERLKFDNMPRNDDLYRFAQSIAVLCGRKIVDQSPESRVVLLA
jgi:tRNA wybutosine-synthesizing protein 1